jgi:hypothetical protein
VPRFYPAEARREVAPLSLIRWRLTIVIEVVGLGITGAVSASRLALPGMAVSRSSAAAEDGVDLDAARPFPFDRPNFKTAR